MAAGETARLIATLELKDLFSKQLGSAEKQLGSFDTKLDKTQSRAYRAGQQIGTGIKRGTAIAVGAIGFLATNVALGVSSLEKLENVTTQTNAVLKSTKGVAGETADSIREMSNRFENLNATMDDTAIQSGANVLLTFTNIRKKAFEPALKAALDLSTAMGQDLQSSVVQIGKALNDPIKGITALTRVGVTFDAAQKKQIESLVKANKTYEAQKIIIAELNREFGGSFLGQGNTTAGKFARVRDAVDDLQRSLATALLPALSKIAGKASEFLTNPAVVAQVSKLGDSIAGLFSDENLAAAGDTLKSLFDTAKTAAPIIEASAKATLGFVQAAVGVFKSLPQPIQALIVGGFALNKLTGGLVTNLAGGILGAVKGARGQTPATPLYVADVTGGLGAAGGAGGGLLKSLGGLVTKLGGLALAGGGLAGIGAGVSMGGPAGAGAAALGGAATIGGLALAFGPAGAIVGSITAVGKTLLDIRDQSKKQGDDIAASVGKEITGGAKLADLHKSLDAVNTGINDIQANPLNVLVAGDALDQLKAQRDALEKAIAVQEQGQSTNAALVKNAGAILDRGGRETGKAIETLAHTQNVHLIAIQSAALREVRQTDQVLAALQKARGDNSIRLALRDLANRFVKEGRGGANQTVAAIKALKSDLSHIHDPKLSAAIRATIGQLEAKLPQRQFVAAEYAKADRIARDGHLSTAQKIARLQAVERELQGRNVLAAKTIQAKIDAMKASVRSAADRTTAAVKAKKLSITNNITVPVTTTINSRGVVAVVSRYDNYVSRTNKIAI